MKVQITATTDGKGEFTEEVRSVAIDAIKIAFSNQTLFPGDPFYGELRAYFMSHGFTADSWNIDAHGLIYKDKGWLKDFKAGLRELGFSIKAVQNVRYSEKDMQGHNFVSLDIGPAFYRSWCRLNKEES